MIKLVIFDLDGTLVDAYKAVSSSLNYAMKQMGLAPIDDEIIKRKVGWGEKILVGSFVPAAKLEETLNLYRGHHEKALTHQTEFLPGAKKLLDDLQRQGLHLAIASNRPSYFTDIILKTLKVQEHFKCVLCADKVARPKPAGDLLEEILKRLSLKNHEAIYVGDMTIDVETGQKAGVKTVAVVTGSSSREEIKALNPFRIISDITEVGSILASIRFEVDYLEEI